MKATTMRTIVDNATVAYLWSGQLQHRAQSHNGNFRFEGDYLYSYKTVIGCLHNGVPLLTSRVYSTTTSGKHMGPARRWTQYQAIEVPMPHEPRHPVNIAYLEGTYDAAIQALRRVPAHRHPHEYELERPRKAAEALARFNAAFHVPGSPPQWARDVADALEHHRAKVEAWNTPKAREKRLRAKAKRDLMRLVEGRVAQ
jgi:hypothetical protein